MYRPLQARISSRRPLPLTINPGEEENKNAETHLGLPTLPGHNSFGFGDLSVEEKLNKN
jgi:hypothetical protein